LILVGRRRKSQIGMWPSRPRLGRDSRGLSHTSPPTPHYSEKEVIPAHLRDLWGGGGLPAWRGPARLDGEFISENVVPGRLGMGKHQDALGGSDQNDLVMQPEGLGPLRRQADPIPWFDRRGLGRIHRCLKKVTATSRELVTVSTLLHLSPT